jgi:hypothetical protein
MKLRGAESFSVVFTENFTFSGLNETEIEHNSIVAGY